MNINEARQIVASAAHSRMREYPPDALSSLLTAARTLRDELDRVLSTPRPTQQMAAKILRDYDGWVADQHEPVSLREGYVRPCDAALYLARAVIADVREHE